MQVLFVGYGSMAKRHIANLQGIMDKRGQSLSIDLLRHCPSVVPEGIEEVYTSADEVKGFYDAVFITNPTAMHYETLMRTSSLSSHFFLEKPAFEHFDKDIKIFSSKLVYVACPLRYTAVISWLKENYDFTRARSLRAMSSSFLPDWRPGIDYRDTYSAHIDQGGGVSIDLIHEWDYLQYLIGYPRELYSVVEKKSALEIDSDDIAVYLAEYEDKMVELHLDYFGRVPLRTLEIIGDEDTLVCDLVKSEIVWLGSGESISFGEARDDFQRKELEHFLSIIEGRQENDNSLERALRTLKLARGVL